MSVDWIKDEAIDNVHGLRDYMEKKKKKKKKDEDIAPINDAPSWIKESALEDIAPYTITSTNDTNNGGFANSENFYDRWGKLTEAEDFVSFSEQGAAIKNPTVKEAEGWLNLFGKRFGAEDVGNIVTYSRDNINEILLSEFNGGGGRTDMLGDTLYAEMTDDEVNIYNYLLAKDGKDKAQEYLDDIKEILLARRGGKSADAITKIDNKAAKAITYGTMSVSAGLDQFASGVKQFFSKEEQATSATAVANQILLEELDGFSEKAYQAGNVVGNMLPSILVSQGLGSVGVATKVAQGVGAATVGLSSSGNATKQALSDGYSQVQARAYGNIVGAFEGGLQYLLGGIGKLGGVSTSKIMGKIATIEKALPRIAAKYAVDTLAEITEEELQLYIEPAIQSIILGEEYDAPTIEEMLDTAIVTAMSTVALNAAGDIKSGSVSTVEGLTPNEAKVVEKEVENRIAEREAKGEKLTKKDKNKIYDEVMEDLPKGYISTDTIESVLDGEGYESYKNLRDKESSLNERISSLDKEINTLLDKENPTIRDNERLAEARKELETAKSDLEKIGGHINEHITYTRHNMNEVLKGERRGKGSYLSESYNEIGRLSERYVADFSKYEGAKHADAARQTIENAMKRGANNTNRVHDIVDLGASLSADTGIVFDWAGDEDIKAQFIEQQKKEIAKLEALTELSEEQTKTLTDLKEMLRKVEAGEVKVNGNITDDSIVINLDSKKALESIVGHEIAHSLENTKAYQKLKEALFAYAKKKGVNIEAEIEAKTKTYKGVKKAKPEAELVADLVGDYIFNDYNFVLDLAMNNKNTFQKLWDDVKYLCKLATTGSKEARDLARARHNFERAYRESVTKASETAKKSENYSLSVDNSQNLVYNGKRGDGYARTDEFRRLQEESQRMSAEEWNFYLRGGKNEVVRRRVATILQRQIDSFRRSGGFNNGSVTLTGKNSQFNMYEDVEPSLFHDVFEVARKYLTNGELVDLHGIETTEDGIGYNDCYNYLSEDGLSGFSITPDGDLISVFNASDKGGFLRAISGIVKAKAKTLDCYVSPQQNLMGMYEYFFGFKTASVMDYNMDYDHDNIAENHGEPKIAFMVNTDADVETKTFTKDQYDEAVTYRNGFFAPENTNAEPTADPDIRYSLSEDSDGRKLSDNQAKYFEGSKVIDDNGNLKVVYHGSPADFNEFSLKYLGTNGTQEGYGFYFTDSKRIAEGYSKGEGNSNGRLFETYLDIKKPLSDTEVTMSRAQFRKLLIELNNQVDADGENLDILSNYGDVEWEGFNKVLNYAIELEYDGNDNDVDIIHSLINSSGNMETVFNVLREVTGYDGIIVKEAEWGGDQTIYIAFHPEQIKNIDNLNPTDNPNINMSLSEEGEQLAPLGRRGTYGKDFRVQGDNVLAPAPEAAPVATTTETAARSDLPISDIDYAPIVDERSRLEARVKNLQAEMDSLAAEAHSLGDQLKRDEITVEEHEARVFGEIRPRYNELAEERLSVEKQLKVLDETEAAEQGERIDSLTDADAPSEIAPYYGEETQESATPSNPFEQRDYTKVGNPKEQAYTAENPEAKPFFQEAAQGMLGDLQNTLKGERWYNDALYSESGGEQGFSGTRRDTTADIADLLDGQYHYTYQQIEDALNAIINDGKLNACAKRIEFALNDRLLNGYTDINGMEIPPNQDYINMLGQMRMAEDIHREGVESIEHITEAPLPQAEAEAVAEPTEQPKVKPSEVIAPMPNTQTGEERTAQERRSDPKAKEGSWWSRTKKTINDVISLVGDKGWVFENLSKKTGNRELEAKYDFMKNRSKGVAQEYINERLLPIYDKVLKTGKLEEFGLYSRHLLNIDRMSLETAENTQRRAELRKILEGYTEKQIESMASETITRSTPKERIDLIFSAREYVDRGGVKGKNKPVFGSHVTAEKSRNEAARLEAMNPEFKEFEEAVLEYNRALREYAVKQGLITRKTADLWAKMYPHYVPIRRTDKNNAYRSVPLDTKKTGVNSPFKRATGGNSDFEPLFETMAQNTEQIFRAVSRNRFGIELMETIEAANLMDAEKSVDAETRKIINEGKLPVGTRVKAHDRENVGVVESYNAKTGKYSVYFKNQQGHHASVTLNGNILTPLGAWNTSDVNGAEVDPHEVLESIDENDKAILKEGKNGASPSFTVFVNGKRVEFDITEEMYKAMKPTDGMLAKTLKPANWLADKYKKLLTEYDPTFSLFRNPIKDTKDVLFNSRHAFKTYATAPKTMKEFATKGKYFTEYRKAGGQTITYYDSKTKTFEKEKSAFKKVASFPIRAYSNATQKVEMFWRLSEYIASRESGASIEEAMLDAARVTTNFGAGGDLTMWANRNGALFLNPSVQGVMQIGRNAREAYHEGAKGVAILAAKVLATGMGGLFFNWLLWDDDEDYEELSDYAKQNYYMIWKTEDGKFVRIPKGRMEAVIQNGFEQMENLITGDDDVDMLAFAELVANNIAPNNPLRNNLLSPVSQALSNKTWYGEDLVPTRLQDVPNAEQFDESTDAISKWIGEKTNTSPIKWNYLAQQYGGGAADVVLPWMTAQAEHGADTFIEKALAPVVDEVMIDSVMKNQNVSDFYDKVDELTVNANGSRATDEDILMSKYMNSVSSEIGKLYGLKREVQNSDLPDSRKYEKVRDIQDEINSLARESLDSYANVWIDGNYAEIGDRRYKLNSKGSWEKVSDDDYDKQEDVTEALGISASDYWSDKSEHDFAYKYPEKYVVAKSVGGYDSYKSYMSDLYEIKADKDENGKSITGSRKEKVIAWLNEQEDLDYGEAIILFKSEYKADDTYNMDIIDYLNGRDDISYDEMSTILKELGFNVDSKGNITWD